MGEIPFGAAQGVPQEDGQLLFLLAGREDRPRQSTIKACHTDGLSEYGFAPVFWHPLHKTHRHEWHDAVKDGKLLGAIKGLNPGKRGCPYTVLCAGERYLHAKRLLPLYRRKKIVMWQCPATSPDLNPVETCWGWMRRKLRKMALADLKAKRTVLQKPEYIARIKSIFRTGKAQQVANAFAWKFRSSCKQLVLRRGAAADH